MIPTRNEPEGLGEAVVRLVGETRRGRPRHGHVLGPGNDLRAAPPTRGLRRYALRAPGPDLGGAPVQTAQHVPHVGAGAKLEKLARCGACRPLPTSVGNTARLLLGVGDQLLQRLTATCCVPMFPEAPALFSTTMGWPRRFPGASAISRPLVSVTPPGAKGAISRIGLSGYCDWAAAAKCSNKAKRIASVWPVQGVVATPSDLRLC